MLLKFEVRPIIFGISLLCCFSCSENGSTKSKRDSSGDNAHLEDGTLLKNDTIYKNDNIDMIKYWRGNQLMSISFFENNHLTKVVQYINHQR